MSKLRTDDILFVGWGGADGVTHFRSVLPARMLDADLLVIGNDGKIVINDASKSMHQVIIVQNCWHEWQLKHIQNMKRKGAKVIANVDDWIKAISKMDGKHAFSQHFAKSKVIGNHYRFMRECDGVLVSTPWLERRIKQFNDNVEVARNLIDLSRFDVPAIERDAGTIIGWSGGTGHLGALNKVANAVMRVMDDRPDVQFVTLGENVRKFLTRHTDRIHTIDWQDLHTYPRDMVVMDIGIAPTEDNDFYRAKSQLRFYEAGAAGIPLVASPHYDEIEHGVTGLISETEDEWYANLMHLVDNPRVRATVATNAQNYVRTKVGNDARKQEWLDAIGRVCDTKVHPAKTGWKERLQAVSRPDPEAYMGLHQPTQPGAIGRDGAFGRHAMQLYRGAADAGTDAV